MPFTAGDLCCSQNACVMLDETANSGSASWDTIPHVTQIQWTEQANTPKLVTSSSAGNEISVCGTVSNTGVLAIACHDGDQPAPFAINGKYHIMWSIDCDNLGDSPADPYYRATIRIVTVPNDFNIAGGGAVIVAYGFEIIEWLHKPTPQTQEN
jgi:hypothetical protein